MWKLFKECRQGVPGLVSQLFPQGMSFWYSCLEYGIFMCNPNLNKFCLTFSSAQGCWSVAEGGGRGVEVLWLDRVCCTKFVSTAVTAEVWWEITSLWESLPKNSGKNNLEWWQWCTGGTSLSVLTLCLGRTNLKQDLAFKGSRAGFGDWTPWWGSWSVVLVNAEQISLNVASSYQIT